ncbi:MAG: 4Fe-4S binding protein [Candidatus Methylomirabilales bacterium]
MEYLEHFIHRVSGDRATVETSRCLREHSGLSDCHLCVKSCPVSSIDLSGGVHVLDHCTGCGACLTVCPVSAFDLNGAGVGELLSQAASFLQETPSLFITCERSESAASGDIVLPCLARLDETLVFGALALGARTLHLSQGPCQACPYPEAMPRYHRMLDRIRGWSRLLPGALERFVEGGGRERNQQEPRRSRLEGPDRRAFFGWVGREGMRLMAGLLDDVSQGFQGRIAKGGIPLPVRNRLLPNFLKSLGVQHGEAPYDPEGPFAEILLDEVKCNGCEACVQICPTGAIQRRGGEEFFRLTFDASRCVNCTLCLDACIPNALTCRQGLSLNLVASRETRALVEKEYRRCSRCDVRFLFTEETGSRDLCPGCVFLVGMESSPAAPEEESGASS